MSSTARISPPPAPSPAAGFVISRRFDLCAFVAPPFVTALFLLGVATARKTHVLGIDTSLILCAIVWVGLAQSHFGATTLFFLDRRHLSHYRREPLVFIVVPLALIGGYLLLGLTSWASAAMLVIPLASFWHGSRQSFGVCGLYRGLTRSFDETTRRLELACVFTGGACFTAIGALRLGMLGGAVPRFVELPEILQKACWGSLLAAATLLASAEWRAWRQSVAAGVAPGPRAFVLFAAWIMYAPYLVAADVLSAFLAALIPHYVQYHALMYLIHRNKVAAGVVPARSAIAHVVQAPARYAAATVIFGLALGAVLLATRSMGRIEVGLCLVAGINMAHFWLDGFFWRFRDPHMREQTLRFLQPSAAARQP